MEWTVEVPEKYQDLLRKVGVDTSSCDDDVHDALVGLFARLSTLDGETPPDEAELVAWMRYHLHIGAQSRRIWWSISAPIRRVAADIALQSASLDCLVTPEDDPRLPERLGLDSGILMMCTDVMHGPASLAAEEGAGNDGAWQDPVWLDRDGRIAFEELPRLSDVIADEQYEEFLEQAARSRLIADLLAMLPEQERMIVDLYFGLTDAPITAEEFGEYFDLSESAVMRKLRRAISRMVHPSNAISSADHLAATADIGSTAPLDEAGHLALLVPEPDGPAEGIVEALWVVDHPLSVHSLALLTDDPTDTTVITERAHEEDRLLVDETGFISILRGSALSPKPWRWKPPAGERRRQAEAAARVLRRNRRPMPYRDLEAAVAHEVTTRNLRNVLTSSPQFNRADRDVFALSHWRHEPYDSVEGLMKRFIERSGGEADIDAIIEDLTTRFSIKEATVRVYANTDAFVKTGPRTIRTRRDGEAVEESPSEVSAIPNCFIVDGRWALRVPIDDKVLRGFSPVIPAGFAHHLRVERRSSVRLRTDLGHEVSIIRKGLSDNIGRLRAIAETLRLGDGDILVVRAPRHERDPLSFSAIRRDELKKADAEGRVRLLLEVDLPLTRQHVARSLGIPVTSTVAAIAGVLRARGERILAQDVLEALHAADSDGPVVEDIAQILGL